MKLGIFKRKIWKVGIYLGVTLASTICFSEAIWAGCCQLTTEWNKGEAIKIEKNLSFFLTDAGVLNQMHPGAGIAFSVLASDKDILVEKCDSTIKVLQPIADKVDYAWEITQGGGNLIGATGNSVIYTLPSDITPNTTRQVKLKCRITASGKGSDDAIEGTATIEIKRGEECYPVYSVTVSTEKLKEGPGVTVTEVPGDCKIDQDWDVDSAIEGSIDVPSFVAAGGIALLKASFTDKDKLFIKCVSQSQPRECFSDLPLGSPDPILYSWSASEGSFPLGNQGPCVIYQPPKEPNKELTITLKIKDSGTQISNGGITRQATTTSAKVDLTEINIEEKGQYKYFTAGHPHRFTPLWTINPKGSAQVTKIDWCTDLGGDTGKIEKAREIANSQDQARLRFTTADSEKDLEVSWKMHSHIHGEKTLACRITWDIAGVKYTDYEWEKSDFLYGEKINKFKLFFDKFPYDDDGRWRTNKAETEDKWGPKPMVNAKEAQNWFVHWSASTYAPCIHDLKSEDPKYIFQETLPDRYADYYENKENVVRVSKKVSEKIDCPGFKPTGTDARLRRSSQMKWIKYTQLPKYNKDGIDTTTKVIVHELAHWESMTKNWRADQTWQSQFGPRTTTAQQIRRVEASAAKNFEVVRNLTSRAGNKVGDDAQDKYTYTIRLFQGSGTERNSVFDLELTGVWELKSGDYFIIASGRQQNQRNDAVGRALARNGLLLEREGTTLIIWERPNDPDEDYVPNVIEDDLGLEWDNCTTYTTFYFTRPHLRADQEFWAEWSSRASPLGVVGNDWANPGAQTKAGGRKAKGAVASGLGGGPFVEDWLRQWEQDSELDQMLQEQGREATITYLVAELEKTNEALRGNAPEIDYGDYSVGWLPVKYARWLGMIGDTRGAGVLDKLIAIERDAEIFMSKAQFLFSLQQNCSHALSLIYLKNQKQQELFDRLIPGIYLSPFDIELGEKISWHQQDVEGFSRNELYENPQLLPSIIAYAKENFIPLPEPPQAQISEAWRRFEVLVSLINPQSDWSLVEALLQDPNPEVRLLGQRLLVEHGRIPSPELVITNLTLSPATPRIGENVTLQMTIFNPSSTEVKDVVPVFIIDAEIFAKPSLNIAGGQSINVNHIWQAQPGLHSIVGEVRTLYKTRIAVSSLLTINLKAEAEFIRGDANNDGRIDLADGIWILNYLFQSGPAPECLDAADPNDDGGINIADAIYIFNYLFTNGPAPQPPFPEAGTDPTQDDLSCGIGE